jgi:hypothetical protein
LGGKCRACSQVARLRFDCIRTQLIHHTAGTPAGKKFRFLYHQLLHGNLQLLCADCDEKKRVGQLRAYGHFRRLLFGRKLIGWCGTNASAASALSSRLRGEIPAKIRVKPLIEPVECSVESCGHVKQLHWLAADERTKRLLFICEDCLPKAPPHFRRLALLCELCGNFQARKPIYSPAELPLVDFANN